MAERVLGGTAVLSMGVLIERGASFLANILAARFAGSIDIRRLFVGNLYREYQISTYAAGGIGATATRFSGKYLLRFRPITRIWLARALTVVSLVSACVGGRGFVASAPGPIAHLLGQ